MKITQRLIREKNFSFICVEGDWPDCYRVNRFVKGYSNSGNSAYKVLNEFNRWPTWMWANWEMVAFIQWLKNINDERPLKSKIGFYGVDIYSFWESMEDMIKYFKKNDPHAYRTAKDVMKCFESFGKDEGLSYARASTIISKLCERKVKDLFLEIRSKISHYNSDHENVFSTEQNALIALNTEKYYRAMMKGGAKSWNIRDRHMVLTLNRLMKFHGNTSKVIVWEHNTHIGDARATDMASEGMVNVGQLMTEQHAEEGVVSVGFGSYKGSVIAGRSWGDVIRKVNLPMAIDESWEQLFHSACEGKNRLLLFENLKDEDCFSTYIDHRAVGVVYNPENEMNGNYVPTIFPMRYDAFIFIDETTALRPLHIEINKHQVPVTFPFGV